MGDFENAVLELRNQGLDDLADTFDQFSATALRKKASRVDELEREKQELETKLRKLEQAPKVEDAFRKAGVDFESLRPAEREALAALQVEDGDLTEEFVAQVITKYDLPVASVDTQNDEGEAPNAAAVVAAARQAPQGRSSGTTISPGDTEGWSTEKLMRLKQSHPEEFEALKRGETVTGIAFN